MTEVRVAALQMVSGTDVQANLKTAARLIAGAAAGGARLAVLPEAFAAYGDAELVRSCSLEESTGSAPLQGFLATQARRHGIYLVGGTIPLMADDGRSHATTLVHDPRGECIARYNKIHLFDAQVADNTGSYCESREYVPGDAIVTVPTELGVIGLAVCYDIRFPEMFRSMLDQGVEILAVPSAFTRRTGLAHWLPLLKARAIENQWAVVGANQGGINNVRRETSGGSVIIDCWGQVLAEAGFGEACVMADIDLAAQQAVRQRMPVRQHRRIPVG